MLERISGIYNPGLVKTARPVSSGGADFKSVLKARLAGMEPPKGNNVGQAFQPANRQAGKPVPRVRFSAHASARLASREIRLSDADAAGLARGVDMAASKGARDALVLIGDLGLIVNVPNRIVVTAVDTRGDDGRVFTNIDSTVVLPRKGPAL